MNRNLLWLALAAACGGGNKNTQPVELGTTHAEPTGGGGGMTTQAPANDPHAAFRKTFVDPGGMWMPEQMKLQQHVDNFQKMGVKLDAKVLADPLSDPLAAIVSIGGCTASFVSPDGLIITNHHCAQGALQLNSTPEKNYVENGFLAKTRADEPSAGPAQRVMVLQAYRDVTKEMRDGLEAVKDPAARKDETDKRMKTLVAACEKDRPGIRCNVSAFFRGAQYQLFEMLEIRDMRLVYAPARTIGDYGGEIDNWEWPRHTGDWSFFRAYVGKDGKPADYSPDNVPYQPKHYLKVAKQGLKAGDFVMVTGYPGGTDRMATAAEVHHDLEWFYPYLISFLDERYKMVESHLKDGGEIAIKATTAKQGIQNGIEKYQGIIEGMKKGDLAQRKDELDKRTREWAAQPGHEPYKAAIDKLDTILEEEFRTARVDFDRGQAFGGSRLMGTSLSLIRWSEERLKKDADRKPGYQDRDMPRAQANQKQFAKTYDRTLDHEGFRLSLLRALQLPEADRPWLATLLNTKKGQKIDEALIEKTLDTWYKGQLIEDQKLRLDLLEKGTAAQLKASKDPFVQAALRIWTTYKAEEKKHDAIRGELTLVSPMYADAMRQMLGGALAPDANGTLRVTYGTVKSLKPESHDVADWPFTVGSQILAKDTGKDPFNAPQKELDALKAKKYGPYADPALRGELPINFESDLDITGGNSGSPTLNDKGEIVGLAFDGNKEGLASDVLFNGATTRTIHCDIRYVLWSMDLLDGADHLLKEMGVTPAM